MSATLNKVLPNTGSSWTQSALLDNEVLADQRYPNIMRTTERTRNALDKSFTGLSHVKY